MSLAARDRKGSRVRGTLQAVSLALDFDFLASLGLASAFCPGFASTASTSGCRPSPYFFQR
jgi:hypothetical protein